MKKSIFMLLFMIAISACNHNGTSSFPSDKSDPSNSISNGQSSVEGQNDYYEYDYTKRFNAYDSVWGYEIGVELQKAIGGDLPKLNYFPASKMNVEYGFESGNALLPYVEIYYENGSNYVEEYKQLLNNIGFASKGSMENDGAIWWYYQINNYYNKKIIVHFSYYSNLGKTYFDIYTYLEESGGGLPVSSEVDFEILPSNFGTSYPTSAQTFSIDGVEMECYYTMNQAGCIQLKKGENAYICNKTALNEMYSLYIDIYSGQNFKVEAGETLTSMQQISPSVLGVYPLNNAKYFKITNTGNLVLRINSIDIFY